MKASQRIRQKLPAARLHSPSNPKPGCSRVFRASSSSPEPSREPRGALRPDRICNPSSKSRSNPGAFSPDGRAQNTFQRQVIWMHTDQVPEPPTLASFQCQRSAVIPLQAPSGCLTSSPHLRGKSQPHSVRSSFSPLACQTLYFGVTAQSSCPQVKVLT